MHFIHFTAALHGNVAAVGRDINRPKQQVEREIYEIEKQYTASSSSSNNHASDGNDNRLPFTGPDILN